MNPPATAARVKPNAFRWIIGVVILVLISGVGLTIISRAMRFSDAVKKSLTDADAGFKKATNTIDPEALRAWALVSAHNKTTYQEITNSMPKEMFSLYDEAPEVQVESSGVTLNWGGGFFNWIMYIGATNDTLPHISENREYPYNFEWRPGIYYTRGANKELQ